jgi:hypothetical protein
MKQSVSVQYALLVVTIFFLASFLTVPGNSQASGRTVIPVDSQWPGARPSQLFISDDGRCVVFSANRGNGWQLLLHDMQLNKTQEIPGLGENPYDAEISPNGKWLLFGKKAWFWKVPLSGGEITLLHASNPWCTWETDETIIISRSANGLWRIKADGSTPVKAEQVASVDKSAGATSYLRPIMLPGGRGVLVSVLLDTGALRIGIISLPGGKLTLLEENGINPRYSESGHILYMQGNTLKAIPFDLGSLKVLGPGATVIDGIQMHSNLGSELDIASNGVLVYVAGPSFQNLASPRSLVWVDRSGKERPFDTTAEKAFGIVRLSPNKRYLAAEVGTGLHLFDRQSGTWTVLAETGNSGAPVWSRDSGTLFYSRAGVLGRQSVKPGEAWEELWRDSQQFWPHSLSLKDDQALGTVWSPETGFYRLMNIGLQAQRTVGPLLEANNLIRRSPVIFPDGQWLAYVERTAGLDQVYVQPFPAGGPPLRVSYGGTGEGSEPLWGRSSTELFYRDGVNMVAVQLESTPSLRVKQRTSLSSTRPYYNLLNTFVAIHDFDPATDRFLVSRNSNSELPGTDIQVIKNAFELLNRVAPRK